MKRIELRDRQQWGRKEMVSTGSAHATLAALDVLADGGNAVDAAIAASAVLTVALPMACGPGGDAAVVLHMRGVAAPLAVTSLGHAPAGVSATDYRARGLGTVPRTGFLSATTPALIDSWFALSDGFGTMPLGRLLEPAIALAEEGLVVTPQFARWTKENLVVLQQAELREIYAPAAAAEAVGTTLRQQGLATLYRRVASASGKPESFRVDLGRMLAESSGRGGGPFQAADCIASHARVEPAVQAVIAGKVVSTTPAPTQGALLLQNLAIYERLGSGVGVDSPNGIHLLSEIINQTYGWRLQHLTDPDFHHVSDPLDGTLLSQLEQEVNPHRRSPSAYAGHYSEGDTSHFAVLDQFGNGISWVQSLGLGFGAGVGIPEWGLLLCNRLGRSATLSPTHINRCEPGKRPVNTIFPWSVADVGGSWMLGGTPGGDGQTQWNAQTLAASIIDGLGPVPALTLPKWTYYPGSDKLEARMSPHLRVDATMADSVVAALQDLGHDVVRKANVGGVTRMLQRGDGNVFGLDDGRQEGLTAGR